MKNQNLNTTWNREKLAGNYFLKNSTNTRAIVAKRLKNITNL